MHIVQIAPQIARGSGVAGVAWNLEREWRALGHTVESFTMAQLGRRPAPDSGNRVVRALQRIVEAVDFSVNGTRAAKRFLAERPHAASVCHNAVLTGDIYVNHGVLLASFKARGGVWWRVLRNPLHIFTTVRDRIRYRSRAHRAIVALSQSEVTTLRQVYPRLRPPIHVIPNAVDLERFRPPTDEQRREARAAFNLDDEDRVVIFVGHEFDRKGLHHAIDALGEATTVMLLVVGGNEESIGRMRRRAEARGVADRVLFAGRRGDLPLLFAASDMFTLPSAYEANALVVLEALASGIPVIATPVGFAPEIVRDGVNGALVPADPHELAAAFERFAADAPGARRDACRQSVLPLTWRATAQGYVDLLAELRPELAERAP